MAMRLVMTFRVRDEADALEENLRFHRAQGVDRFIALEDGVTVYAGTTIMGADTVIGAGSTIGANVFLTHSVPPRSLVFYEEKQLKVLPKRGSDQAAELEWHI